MMNSRTSRLGLWGALSLVLLMSAACNQSPTDSEPDNRDWSQKVADGTITGTLTPETAAQIPVDARLQVFWSVIAPVPDYMVLYGEGIIDRTANTFSITFDQPPADDLLNSADGTTTPALGVGYVVLTSGINLQQGDKVGPELAENVIGVVDNTCLLYVKGDPGNFPIMNCGENWLQGLLPGWNVGRGVELPQCAFDGFLPGNQQDMVLILGDVENFTFPNWN